jgi:uncharacterized protein with GYD domain
MPKYLVQVSYTLEGLRGLVHDSATHRAKVGEAAAESLGGRLEAAYWAFGEHDLVAIAEFPDNSAAAAFGLELSASGALKTCTTPLLTAAEVDKAIKKRVDYTPPGTMTGKGGKGGGKKK